MLFILNIIVGITMVLMELLVLFLRSGILNGAEEASLEDGRENNPATNNTIDNLGLGIYIRRKETPFWSTGEPTVRPEHFSEPQAKDMEWQRVKRTTVSVWMNDRDTVLASHDSSKGPESVKDDVEFHI